MTLGFYLPNPPEVFKASDLAASNQLFASPAVCFHVSLVIENGS